MTKKHILVVDDEKNFLATIDFILEAANYQVTLIDNGQKALETILNYQKHDIQLDLLITDIRMPYLGGLELITKIRKLGIRLPTIVITNHSSRELKRKLEKQKCVFCLDKPIDDDELLSNVAKLLAGKSDCDKKL